MVRESWSKNILKPGKPGKISCKDGWTLENEIEWLEFYIKHQQSTLNALYEQRAWWERFIDYCNGKTNI